MNLELPGVSIIPAASEEGPSLFLAFDEIFPNGPTWQTRALSVHEAGDLAFAIWTACTEAIALGHQFKADNGLPITHNKASDNA